MATRAIVIFSTSQLPESVRRGARVAWEWRGNLHNNGLLTNFKWIRIENVIIIHLIIGCDVTAIMPEMTTTVCTDYAAMSLSPSCIKFTQNWPELCHQCRTNLHCVPDLVRLIAVWSDPRVSPDYDFNTQSFVGWNPRSMKNYAETWILIWESLIKSLKGNK